MKNLKQLVAMTVIAVTFLLGGNLSAQAQSRTNRVGNPGLPGGMDWQNMDPQEMMKMMQQRMLDMQREQLEVTDDAEWKIVEERLSKVTQARMATMADGGGMMGFGGMGGMGGRGPGGGGPGGGRGLQSMFGQPSAESQALQQAIESKASTTEIKQKLVKLQEVRKQKQADLLKAQTELRKVLSPRQEAVAVLMGLLE